MLFRLDPDWSKLVNLLFENYCRRLNDSVATFTVTFFLGENINDSFILFSFKLFF